MGKLVKKEQDIAKHSPTLWPLIFIVVGAILIIGVLGYLLWESKNENAELQKKSNSTEQDVGNYEDEQMQDYENIQDGL
jgi:FtsZ-interacting cell division protein ZipA